MVPNRHQLAILREKLAGLIKQRHPREKHKISANQMVALDNQINQVKAQINNLGARGTVSMALVVKKKFDWSDEQQSGQYINETLTYFFMDLDDESIYVLLDAWLKNGESYLSKSIIQVPLKKALPASVKDNIISWQIIS